MSALCIRSDILISFPHIGDNMWIWRPSSASIHPLILQKLLLAEALYIYISQTHTSLLVIAKGKVSNGLVKGLFSILLFFAFTFSYVLSPYLPLTTLWCYIEAATTVFLIHCTMNFIIKVKGENKGFYNRLRTHPGFA